ncbi:hypothetical protein [Rhodococcus qingshengii]|uniref:ImmA/IrrE family metallo-endopeptidase n=1 Tax=Rhodococcus qingshengii TaxID=334542 RepID=A0A2A5IXC6_RHOSG|nr:hypothetical protein [Rhodococcus qingshengii]PCK22014.1 hypothetical protein CHR55_33295 [Rhodococcus qingshengii]
MFAGQRGLRRAKSRRSRLEAVVAELDLPEAWTVDEFVTAVEKFRSRGLQLIPLPDTALVGLCGVWLATPDIDVIFHRPTSDPAQRHQTITHECAHMLLNHGVDDDLTQEQLAELLTGISLEAYNLDLSMVKAARGMTDYDDPDEYDAELFATIITTQASEVTARSRGRILRAF